MRRYVSGFYMLRVPLLTIIFLGVVLPLSFRTPILRGIAHLQPHQIWFASLSASLLVSAAITTAFLVLLYGGQRLYGEPKSSPAMHVSNIHVALLYAAAAVCYMLFLVNVFKFIQSSDPERPMSPLSFAAQAGLGTLVAGVIVFLPVAALVAFSDPLEESDDARLFTFPGIRLIELVPLIGPQISKVLDKLNAKGILRDSAGRRLISGKAFVSTHLLRLLGPGYGKFDAEGQPVRLYPGHRYALILLVVTLALYVLVGWHGFAALENPTDIEGKDYMSHDASWDSVLVQVLLLAQIWCWFLTGLSFWADRFRLPVLLPLALVFFLLSMIWPRDHVFSTIAAGSSYTETDAGPGAVFDRSPERLIVVAAAGGGIQSAAWTSHVLCGLHDDVGTAFDKSLVAISGVSGGSVGAFFYLRCREGVADGAQRAMFSSLEHIAWGLAHPDMQRVFMPFLSLPWSGRDRGWALERALEHNAGLTGGGPPLLSLDVRAGYPVLLFNSTESRTGDPLVFTNSFFPVGYGSMDTHRLQNFHWKHPGRDVRIETAVRMSAAYPFVSPAARADQPDGAEHLVDGGYFDNSGIFSLAQWLKEATAQEGMTHTDAGHTHARKKILMMQIAAFPDHPPSRNGDGMRPWYYQVWAPLGAVLRVRGEGQVVRDRSDFDDIATILEARGFTFEWLYSGYIAAPSGTTLATCPKDPPFSWHLTPLEGECIERAWTGQRMEIAKEIKRFLAGEVEEEPEVSGVKEGQHREISPMQDIMTMQLAPGLYLRHHMKNQSPSH